MRVKSENINCVGTTVDGNGYVSDNGFFTMSDKDGKNYLKATGQEFPSNLQGITAIKSIGFRCGNCGFGSFFKICSRCKSECERGV